MRRLKIGIITDQLLVGGVQLAAIEQVKQLIKLGYDVKLLILMRKKYSIDFSHLVKDIPHQFLSDSYPKLFRQTIKFPIFSFLSTLHLISPFFASRVITPGNYDLLISLGTNTSLATYAVFRKHRIPYIAVIHDPIVYILDKIYAQTSLRFFFFLLKPLARYFEGLFVKNAKQTIIISQVHSRYLKVNYGVKAKILGFGTKYLIRLPKKRGNYLLSFGRWQKEKKPEFLLQLIKLIPKTKLIVAGSWITQKELIWFQLQVKHEGLEKQVSIMPHFTQRQLASLCRKSRLWIHPHFEAFGLAALEAAGHGLPIIIPQKSGITETFKHGVHGFFPKSVEINDYKKYVLKLLKDERLAYKMGFSAWINVKKNFSWEASVNQMLPIIKSAINISNKPKIMVLETGHALGTWLAGGDRLMEPMAINLSDKYDFSIIVPQIGAAHWQQAKLKKELLILSKNKLDTSGSPMSIFFAYCIRMLQVIFILKKRLDIDVLYSSTNILPDILPAFFAKKTSSKKQYWIARIHHLIPPPNKREGKLIVNIVSYLMQALSLYLIKKRADIIIALNDSLKEDLIRIGFPKDKLTVLGAGINLKRIQRQKLQQNDAVFDGVFLGRLHPSKGIFDLIPIWKEVVQYLPKAKLAIIGGSQEDLLTELKKQIAKASLTKNISFLGYLPDENVYSTMKKAKVFLFTDHEAGWAIAVAEAMATGLPVVGYNNGILGNIYQKGFMIATAFNHKEFAGKIIMLLKDESLRIKLSKEATKEAAKFEWEKTSYTFSSLVENLVNPKNI